MRSGSATHVGRVRDHNEDAFVARDLVFAVADGMGGHAAGEVASRIAVEALSTLAEQPPQRPEDVAEVLREANRRILRSQEDRPRAARHGHHRLPGSPSSTPTAGSSGSSSTSVTPACTGWPTTG